LNFCTIASNILVTFADSPGANPFINSTQDEFSELAELNCEHLVRTNPLIFCVRIHPEMVCDLVHPQPTVWHKRLFPDPPPIWLKLPRLKGYTGD
jgi:hypothetical protein